MLHGDITGKPVEEGPKIQKLPIAKARMPGAGRRNSEQKRICGNVDKKEI